jgi:hypothetical protein
VHAVQLSDAVCEPFQDASAGACIAYSLRSDRAVAVCHAVSRIYYVADCRAYIWSGIDKYSPFFFPESIRSALGLAGNISRINHIYNWNHCRSADSFLFDACNIPPPHAKCKHTQQQKDIPQKFDCRSVNNQYYICIFCDHHS